MTIATDRRARLARLWSNQELRRIGPILAGSVVNVSAGDDMDKEGGAYEQYFPNCDEYSLTNYEPGSFRGFGGREREYEVDLTQPLPKELSQRFDVVFNHTTLEHIFDVRLAFANLCEMSRQIVIVVVPFSQLQHESVSFKDYWRFGPSCLHKLFEENSFGVVYESANNDVNSATYLFYVGSRKPGLWKHRLPESVPLADIGCWIGDPDLRFKRASNGGMYKRLRSAIRCGIANAVRRMTNGVVF